MEFVFLLLGGAAAGALGWLLLSNMLPLGRRQVLNNLQRGHQANPVPSVPPDLQQRSSLGQRALKALPEPMRKRFRKQWDAAGRPRSYTLEKLAMLKLVGPVAGLYAGWLAVRMVGGIMGLVLGVGLLVLGFFVADLLIWSKAQERRSAALIELPDLIDQMVIAVSAGQGFDSAMDHAAKNSYGPLADEMRRCIQEIQIGLDRRQAYIEMAERTGVPEIQRFIRAINRGAERGVPVSDTLREQAKLIRMQRRMRAEVAAAKIPAKIVMPVVLLIMPVLITIVMAPPFIKIAHEIFHWI